MFKKKKRKSAPATCETDVNGRNIQFYTKNGGATPMAFYTPDVVARFCVEDECQRFIQNADLDMFNGDYMDSTIAAKIEQGYKDIDRQHRCHLATISKLEANIQSDLIVVENNIQILKEAETKLDKKFPQGELQCFKNENRYKWKVKEENGIRYLPKTERNQAEILALKKYYEYRKKELESEAAGWEAYLKKTDKMKINSEHLLNHPEYGKLLAKNFRPLDKELERWQEEPYEKCTKHPENLLVQGTHGKMLRSKSEAIIDRALYQNKIPFHYEEKLILDGIILYPDFVMRHPFTGQYFYWEHFGMMDNPDYCNHACDKIKLYCRHGIIPSVNLILTYETKQCPLNADKVEMILQEYFGCSKWDAVVG